MKNLLIASIIGLFILPCYEANAADPFSEGRRKPFSCPQGYYPVDSDGDGHADMCYKEEAPDKNEREECRKKARTFCTENYAGMGRGRCVNVEYQRCG